MDEKDKPESESTADGTEETVHLNAGGDDPDKTVSPADLDHTLVIGPDEHATVSGTVVRRGDGASQSSLNDATTDSVASTNDATVAIDASTLDPSALTSLGSSVLASGNIGATVNPRELSPDDAKLWNKVASGGSVGGGVPMGTTAPLGASQSKVGDANRSIDPPAMDRTFSDRHFQRLRKNEIAPPHSDPNLPSDYRLNRKLGQGGMGDVYLARQRSLDRLLALKVIKPLDEKRRGSLSKAGRLEKVEKERRMQFLAEAIITGDLDHPNIVPIHDVAMTNDGNLFYSMKRVDGVPWSDVIDAKSTAENLEILLRVCDAIGFAHTRNVVHRDIKPENIMLGDFGVVMVMDWGLALPTGDYDQEKQASILATSGLGGTPAFMAPEMATGPLENIRPAADIYLLGATLFMIVTGHAPHQARNVSECLKVVRSNSIRPVDEKYQGELLDIAHKAMATDPSDRHANVAEFQRAIRDYLSHDQSIGQTNRAYELLARGQQMRVLADFHRASQGFDEAIQSWPGNTRAKVGLAATAIALAETAFELGEYESGIAQLSADNPDHAELLQKLMAARDERESRAVRLKRLTRVAAAMLAFILVGGGVAMVVINGERTKAQDAAKVAIQQRQIAESQTELAVAETKRAEAQTRIATQEKTKAIQAAELARIAESNERVAKELETRAKDQAVLAEAAAKENERRAVLAEQSAKQAQAQEVIARRRAEIDRQAARYEEYVSKIGLAKARLETNDGKGARKILNELRDSPRSSGWEWRWLWQQANQSQSDLQTNAAVIDLSMSTDGLSGVIATDDDRVWRIELGTDGGLLSRIAVDDADLAGKQIVSVAIADQSRMLAIGCRSGQIVLIGDDATRSLDAHTDAVTDLAFAGDDRLVSGSTDRTVRVWNAVTGSELTEGSACWHIAPVQQLATATRDGVLTIAAATSDDSSGSVLVWRFSDVSGKAKQVGVFGQHSGPVAAVGLSDDGRLVASGDRDGDVWIWKVDAVQPIRYDVAIDRALSGIGRDGKQADFAKAKAGNVRYVRLVDPSMTGDERLVSTNDWTSNDQSSAHSDVIRAIRFSRDGGSIVTASDDYTLKVWGVANRDLRATLRGHGGWVTAADFVGGDDSTVVSASGDASIRTWRPASYRGEFIEQDGTVDAANPKKSLDTQAHANEISSATFSPDGTRIVTASRDATARVLAIDPDTLAFSKVSEMVDDEVLDEGTSYVAMSMQTDGDAKRLYIGSADATIRVWDRRRGVEVDRVTGTGLNGSFAVSNDGRFLVSGSSSPAAKAILWRLDPGGRDAAKIVHRFKGHDQAVTAMAITSDGSVVFTGDRDGYGILWDAKTGTRIGPAVETVRGFRINAARFAPDGKTLFIGSDDEQLTSIDVASRNVIRRLPHSGLVTNVSLASDGECAVTLSELSTETRMTTTAMFWDLSTGQSVRLGRVVQKIDPDAATSRRTRTRVTSATFNPAADTVVVSTADRGGASTVRVFEVKHLRRASGDASAESTRFQLPSRLGVAESLLPLDDGTIVTMNRNAAFQWNLNTEKLVKSFRSHAELTQADFSSDGRYVVTASRGVKIWDAKTGRPITKLETPHIGPTRTVAFAPANIAGSDHAFATGGDDGAVRVWKFDPKRQTVTRLVAYENASVSSIRRVAFSSDAKRLLVVGDGGFVAVFKTGQPQPTWTCRDESLGDLICGDFSADGEVIAVGGTDGRVRVWKLEDQNTSLTDPIVCEGHADAVRDLELIGVGNSLRVLTASLDDSARVWDPRIEDFQDTGAERVGREVVSLRRHDGDVTSVDATEDGRLLMTAGADGKVILWPASPPRKSEAENLFDAL